jgi:AmmeMemoRadiSam system protein A
MGGEEGESRSRLSDVQRRALLSIARWSLETFLTDGSEASYHLTDPELEKPAAAFVTLTRKGNLRGCVGYSDPLYALHQTVSRCARSAASEDYRFQPVRPDELAEIRISISVLSPVQKLADLERILIGRDGLLVVGSGRRGLLLPQVAPEQGWDREDFLDGACRKAGLPVTAWREGSVEVFVFQAEVFSESESEMADDTGVVVRT